jgi:hypothetical protein
MATHPGEGQDRLVDPAVVGGGVLDQEGPSRRSTSRLRSATSVAASIPSGDVPAGKFGRRGQSMVSMVAAAPRPPCQLEDEVAERRLRFSATSIPVGEADYRHRRIGSTHRPNRQDARVAGLLLPGISAAPRRAAQAGPSRVDRSRPRAARRNRERDGPLGNVSGARATGSGARRPGPRSCKDHGDPARPLRQRQPGGSSTHAR